MCKVCDSCHKVDLCLRVWNCPVIHEKCDRCSALDSLNELHLFQCLPSCLRCQYPHGCTQEKVNTSYCMWHVCPVKDCPSDCTWPKFNSSYCVRHVCIVKDCLNFSIGDERVCRKCMQLHDNTCGRNPDPLSN